MRFVSLLVVCSLGLEAGPAAKSAFDKATFEDYVRHLLVFSPGVQVKIDDPKASPIDGLKEMDIHVSFGPNEEVLKFYVSNDGRHIINISQGGVYDIARNPFEEDLEKLSAAGAPSFGTPGATLSLIAFSDFECPQCKLEAESLRKNLLAAFPTQVRMFFKDFPLESLHPWAKAAAITGRCILQQGQDHFWSYHDWIYANQSDIKPDNFRSKIDEFAKNEKLDQIQYGHCMDNPAGAGAEVDKEIVEGKALGINATPTLFLNGRRLVGSWPWENLKPIIEADIDYQKTHASTAPASTASDTAADQKCCEISIPSALKK
ncbi:MAG: thioredoxin domain-containing protein [Bryobacteraceae bacterium]|jgi:protein-disulfide isomerase